MRVECFEESVLFCFALCAGKQQLGVQGLRPEDQVFPSAKVEVVVGLRLEVAEGSTLPAPSSPTAPKRRCRNGGSITSGGTSSSTTLQQDHPASGPEVAFATNGEAEAIAPAAAMDGPRRYGKTNPTHLVSRRFFFLVKKVFPTFKGQE